jgi:hypothetical protein
MKLATYLASAQISLSEFSRQIGAKNARTVQRYTKHDRVPSGTMMMKIVSATGGVVQPSDFFDPVESDPDIEPNSISLP